MKAIQYSVYLTFLVAALTGCGSSTKPLSPQAIQEPTRVPSSQFPCGQQSWAKLAVLTTPSEIKVGNAIQLRISVASCPEAIFRVQGRPTGEYFYASLDLSKIYSSAGPVQESVNLEAYNAADLQRPIASQTVRVDFNVLALPSATPQPTSVPTSTPLPGVPTSCAISRVPGMLLSSVDQALPVHLSVSGPYASAKLNGFPVPVGVPIALAPQAPGSGIYSASAEVVTATGSVHCQAQFKTPLCTHTVTDAYVVGSPGSVSLKTTTFLGGPILRVTINGEEAEQLPLPPRNDLIHQNNGIAYVPGSQFSRAVAVSPYGDSVTCSASFSPQFSLSTVEGGITPYFYALGFSAGSGLNSAVVGLGAAASGTKMWTYRTATFASDIFDSSPAAQWRFSLCAADEVLVGRTPWADLPTALHQMACRKLKPALGIRNVSHHIIPWNYLTWGQCPAGKVLVGNIYASGGVGPLGQLDLVCGEIFQR